MPNLNVLFFFLAALETVSWKNFLLLIPAGCTRLGFLAGGLIDSDLQIPMILTTRTSEVVAAAGNALQNKKKKLDFRGISTRELHGAAGHFAKKMKQPWSSGGGELRIDREARKCPLTKKRNIFPGVLVAGKE